jgi:hypothetical protein
MLLNPEFEARLVQQIAVPNDKARITNAVEAAGKEKRRASEGTWKVSDVSTDPCGWMAASKGIAEESGTGRKRRLRSSAR